MPVYLCALHAVMNDTLAHNRPGNDDGGGGGGIGVFIYVHPISIRKNYVINNPARATPSLINARRLKFLNGLSYKLASNVTYILYVTLCTSTA